ncbi:HlyD family type I secretion periplasmic adaptor subunit [Rhodobacteraceae bacterium RKSG542]|nr:HlyD family type I secretion periplasmic adaptor subunit [Pseudovibrio flavus]
MLGFSLLGILVVGFGVWAAAAPIAGAIIASGSFVVTGQNQIIQHLEGGIIEEILVQEGDLVEKGDVLIRLEKTSSLANLRRLELRKIRLDAMESRLSAFIKGQDKLVFPIAVTERANDPEVQEIIESQHEAFAVDVGQLANEVAILNYTIDSLKQRQTGNVAQQDAAREQVSLLDDELKAKHRLLEKNLIRMPEILALQRAQANLRGDIGRLIAENGDIEERIAKTSEEILRVKSLARQRATAHLQEVEAQLDDVTEQIRSSEDVLKRVKIVSPTKGVVSDMRYHTPGGVIESGKAIMEVVPVHNEMLLEVRIRPQDIDNISIGQEAGVRLTALNQRTTPVMKGQVVYVSADARPTDAIGETGEVYFARVSLDTQDVGTFGAHMKDFQPTPGMPAEVHIVTTERTFFEYLTQPIRDSMARAFKEH